MSRSEHLRDRLALMKATLDREQVGIALLTYPEFRYTYANPAMQRVLGTDPVGRLQDETCSDYPWPPRSRMKNVAERGTRLTSRDSRWVMPRLPGGAPEELFFTFEVSRVRVGDTIFLLATAVETTDEVEARKRIDGVVERMQEVLDCVNESIVSLDEHWRLTYANKHAAEMLGRRGDSLLHRSFTDLFGEYEARELEQRLDPAMRERKDVEFEIRLAQDGVRYRVRAFPASSGISVYLAPLGDLGAPTNADERLDALLGMLEVAVTVFDGEGRIESVNAPATELFGHDKSELVGRTLHEIFSAEEGVGWAYRIAEALEHRGAFRVLARHGSGAPLTEHRGVPVEYGTVMVSRPADQASIE